MLRALTLSILLFLATSVYQECNLFLHRTWSILADTVPTTITQILPNSALWLYRSLAGQITSFPLKATVDKTTQVATLYLHNSPKGTSPLLLLHGDHGHPFTTLHLADLAAKHHIGPIFSLHMPYEEGFSPASRSLLKQAIDKIEQIVSSQGSFSGLVAIGHSKGAIQSAHQAFVEKDARIKSVISIAGRLKVVSSSDKPCHAKLKSTVDAICEAVGKNPHIPLYQIAAENDWCVPLEAVVVRQDNSLVVSGASHMNVLYREETVNFVIQQCLECSREP